MDYYPSYTEIELNEVYKDINQAIYMLHYVNEEAFSKKEIREVCFSLKITLITLERMMENGRLLHEWTKK